MEDWVDTFLGRTHPNAPVFWNLTFLIGCWMMMFGVFDLLERCTRHLRQMIRQGRHYPNFLVPLRLIDRQKAERFNEAVFVVLGAIGRKSWRIGIWIMPLGAALGIWRNTVWPYS